ncbi:MAG: ribosome silencing factor [Hahellaceae bacterium]|nr:ribosome silencing factor [Hahellaceae bacterium]MCP5210842.1 ribosome silencing factor [Hahellaceae bacterium]
MELEELKSVILAALEDLKAKDITVIDVRERTSVTDYMIIASGTSNRHVKSLADNVLIEAKNNGLRPLGAEGAAGSDWILVDLGEIVVHVMLPATREFYDLERFWRQAPDASGSIAAE